ncbi:ABC-three component system middle component 1 [Tenacibaculum maritimum]|uniref:ABC-three component system middle component 1 n=1 Tax=Tenacibaculum maritimum TaxID=107401 RepID=UPI0012E6DB2A|nr:ABC-three component system middle component 1 [Tenacibaculum maritimum]CAA0189739.1 conserved hypothetical protein [Tenacibaculum maritimum]
MNYSIDTILNDLKEEFEGISFSYEEINYQGMLPCFFIEIEEKERLADVWMKISDLIAINHQARLENEFSIWNIYLFFIVKEPVVNELKYLIQNDTFSSRKIVVEKLSNPKDIINQHILNADIKIESSSKKDIDFVPNIIFFNQVNNIEAKSRVTNSIKDAYFQIVSEIKKQSHEI